MSQTSGALSTALSPHILGAEPLLGKLSPLGARVRAPFHRQIAPVGVLVRQLPQQREDESANPFHTSSGLNRESTNGASTTVADRVPFRMPIQIRIESIRMVLTITTKMPQMKASSRALKIRVCVSAIFEAANVLASNAASSWLACAKNP